MIKQSLCLSRNLILLIQTLEFLGYPAPSTDPIHTIQLCSIGAILKVKNVKSVFLKIKCCKHFVM